MQANFDDKKIDFKKGNKENTWIVNGEKLSLDVSHLSDNERSVIWNNESHEVKLIGIDRDAKKVTMLLNGKERTVQLKTDLDLRLESMGMAVGAGKKLKNIKAPMPGLVLDVMVEPGQEIKEGDNIVVLEAMKMENVLKATGEATVKSIEVKKGQAIEKNQVIVEFE
jgi:acetyl/propionyl-CoA carboxylase alpha subunit